MLVSLTLVYWFFTIFVPIPSKQQTKHVTTLSVCKNVQILIIGATGCAANVWHNIRVPSNETMGLAPGSWEKNLGLPDSGHPHFGTLS